MDENKKMHPQPKNKKEQQERTPERQEWHQPRIQHLRLSLDTASDGGSFIDSFQTGSLGLN